MATLSELRTDLLLYLRETASDSNFTTDELNSLLNRGVEASVMVTEGNKDQISVTVENNVGAYTLPSDNLLITSAYFGDKDTPKDLIPLEVFTEEILKHVNPYWLDESSGTTGRPEKLIQLDNDTVMLDPRPDSDNAGKDLVLFYVFLPSAMTLDADEPSLRVGFHRIVPFYAAFLAYSSLGNKDKAQEWLGNWKDHYIMFKDVANKGLSESYRFKWAFSEE